jgi:hypothetical protein
MRDVIPELARCTIEHANGKFCDSPSMADTPFPICQHHALKLYKHMLEAVHTGLGINRPIDKTTRDRWTAREASHKEALKAQSVVYYVRIADVIKIGYTTNMKQRMTALRVPLSAVLATEPGGRVIEADRHKQFADLRVGTMENFRPELRLIQHIDAVRDFHGEPNITGYLPSY